jgi:hypothetical protein
MAAIKFRQNRGHLDIGTFHLFGAGSPTITDSGPSMYGSEIYRTYSSQSVAHNLVLVDGKSQVRANGQLRAALATSRMAVASGDLRSAYPDALKDWTRDLVMLPGGLAVVADRLEADEARQFDLVLHPESAFEIDRDRDLLIGPAKNQTRVMVRSDVPLNTEMQDGYHHMSPRKYVRFNSTAQAKQQSFVTVVHWPGRAEPVVQPVGSGRWRIDRPSLSETLAVRIGGSDDDVIRTDARLAAMWQRRRGAGLQAVVLGAKRLEVKGKPVLQADGLVNVAIERGLLTRLSFWNAGPAKVRLFVEPAMRYFHLDGAAVDVAREGTQATVDIPAGEHELVVGAVGRFIPRAAPLRFDDLLSAEVDLDDVPAFRPGVRARASSSWTEPLSSIDGDVNSAWASLPGRPMPEWLEIELSEPEAIRQVWVRAGVPCEGSVSILDSKTGEMVAIGRFTTTVGEPSAMLDCDVASAARLRLQIDKVDPAYGVASIHLIDWSADRPVGATTKPVVKR